VLIRRDAGDRPDEARRREPALLGAGAAAMERVADGVEPDGAVLEADDDPGVSDQPDVTGDDRTADDQPDQAGLRDGTRARGDKLRPGGSNGSNVAAPRSGSAWVPMTRRTTPGSTSTRVIRRPAPPPTGWTVASRNVPGSSVTRRSSLVIGAGPASGYVVPARSSWSSGDQ
jgi:hypothetical protein